MENVPSSYEKCAGTVLAFSVCLVTGGGLLALMLDEFNGRRLRYYRRVRGMSQEKLARAAQIRRATVSDIEAGKTLTPRPDTVMRLARALDVPPARLYGPLGG